MMRWLHRRASDYLGVTAYLVERDHAVAQRTLAYGQLLVAISGRDAALREARESERMADGCRSILSALKFACEIGARGKRSPPASPWRPGWRSSPTSAGAARGNPSPLRRSGM
jgi:hypothetical protein